MVTWTFDLVALIVGFIVGLMVGALIVLFAEFPMEHDLAEWGRGYRAGAETVKEIFTKDKKKDDGQEGETV